MLARLSLYPRAVGLGLLWVSLPGFDDVLVEAMHYLLMHAILETGMTLVYCT
jgi:hypothetical protein